MLLMLILRNFIVFLTEDKNVNRKVFLAGDFNIDLLSTLNHASTNEFIDCTIAHHFLPMILQPTRITPTTATLIDNTFTNYISCITESAILINYVSDHLPIVTWIDLKPAKNSNTETFTLKRSISDEAILSFKSYLSEVDWTSVINQCSDNDPNVSYDHFLKYLCHYMIRLVH